MSFDSDQRIREECGPGERLIWSGVPRQGIRFRSSDFLMVPFSLLWGGFAVFWEYSVTESGAPLAFRLWGIPFVLIGVYITVGRFFADSLLRRRTIYGITNLRVLLVSDISNREVKSFNLATLSEVTLQERSDRSGSILLGPTKFMNTFAAGSSWPGLGRKGAPSIDLIDDVRRVYGLLQDSQQQVRRPTS